MNCKRGKSLVLSHDSRTSTEAKHFLLKSVLVSSLALGACVREHGADIPFPIAFVDAVQRDHEKSKIEEAEALAKTRRVEINGFIFVKDTVTYFSDGKVKSGNLTGEHWKGDNLVWAGQSELSFYPNGQISSGTLSSWALGENIRFEDLATGRSHVFRTKFDHEADASNTFRVRSGTIIKFHDNGVISSCTVSQDVSLQGRFVKAGTVVQFDETGHLVDAPNQ